MQKYKRQFAKNSQNLTSFSNKKNALLHDRFGASHILKPVLDEDGDTFFTSGDIDSLQRIWAKENGLSDGESLSNILLAQIEEHKAEVFYNLDPVRFDGSFVRRLPAHVRYKVAWRAAPGVIDFAGYDLVVSNFPSIRRSYEQVGIRTGELFPSHDPELDCYASNDDRNIDVLFFGGYTRHHIKRQKILDAVAKLSNKYNVVYHLDSSRYTALADSPLGLIGPLANLRKPKAIRSITRGPVFGREMYKEITSAKIVINAAIDMAGEDRGNMRCFEAMGARTLLLTDKGRYPVGMSADITMKTYADENDAVDEIEKCLHENNWQNTAGRGHTMIRELYSKTRQFEEFGRLLS